MWDASNQKVLARVIFWANISEVTTPQGENEWASKEGSAALIDDEVDTLDALAIASSVTIVLEDWLWLPVARVDDVRDTLRVLKPPAIALVTMEI